MPRSPIRGSESHQAVCHTEHMDQSVREFTNAIASHAAPASGSAAAIALAMAAALAEKVASRSPDLDAPNDLVAQARRHRESALAYAHADEQAVREMLKQGSPGPQAVAVPQAIGELAVELVGLATHLVEQGNQWLLADSVGARNLAKAARHMADSILEANTT